jgi:hypothetical protein
MKTRTRNMVVVLASTLAMLAIIPLQAARSADLEGEWKKGRLYYRMVCTACHKAEAGASISPVNKTIAEWKDYFAADQHAMGSDKAEKTVSYYVSEEYRQSIAGENRVAAKFLDIPSDELYAHVRAFAVHGAKDSDTPARCN